MRVTCEFTRVTLPAPPDGPPNVYLGLCLSCDRCEHQVEVLGQGEPSRARARALLSRSCPAQETNVYVVTGPEEEEPGLDPYGHVRRLETPGDVPGPDAFPEEGLP